MKTSTCFIYINNPQSPERVHELLKLWGAQEFKGNDNSWFITGIKPVFSYFTDLCPCAGKDGILYMVDVSKPEEEHIWPRKLGRQLKKKPTFAPRAIFAQFLEVCEADK